MSLQFLGQKSWHPASKANQKRIWVAEQHAQEREKIERVNAEEVRKAADALQAQQAAAAAVAGDVSAAQGMAHERVSFLYAAPPGLPGDETVTKPTQQMKTEEDEAVREFRRKAESRGEAQRKLERYVGHRAKETLTIMDQVERFPMLKDAPVEGQYTATIRVNFNPVGLRLRNVRCVRCGNWGHQSGDRECKLRDQNPNDATRLRREDPVTEINKLKSNLALRRGGLPLEMQEGVGGEVFEILQSDDDEDAIVAQLSMKRRKKRKKQSSSSDSDSNSSDRHYRSKKKKSSKHKRKRYHKRRSRNDESES